MTTETQSAPRPPADPLGDLIVGLLPVLGRFITQTLREQAGPSPERIRLLRQLDRGPVRAGELAQSCLLSPATVSELTESLVREGHVHRDADPSDRRAVVLGITASGASELARIQAALTARIVERLEHLTPDQRARLTAALTDLHAAFTDLPAPKEASRHGR
ncbi:MAG TPA: MarR family winged helix-turn-helix transcriptional regulator [Candidatus Saccharimonadales bacterium]|nr:MarR family winged helix-turn-helix transcriptional regulator [Candidatus Saccharimonadales bacterium]